MLFPYTHVPQLMNLIQDYIDFIFFKVWCKAEKEVDYAIEVLFADYEELEEIIKELHYSPKKGANFFMTGLQQIFEDFKMLSDAEKDQLKHWYYSNNRIDLACCCDPSVSPATYDDVTNLSGDLSQHLKSFFENLYSQGFLSLKSIADRIGDIEDHYSAFMAINSKGKCPFCGINDLRGNYHSKREAYDHFLPKGKYPFNSINFYNLAPACNECNSSYKLSQDPLYNVKSPITDGGLSRKTFYPYSLKRYQIELNLALNVSDWTKIQPDDIELELEPVELRDELDTWLDVYGIDERYKAKCCGDNDGKYWIEQVLDEYENEGTSPEIIFNRVKRNAENSPFADTNFLKASFLQACFDKGIFDGISAVEG